MKVTLSVILARPNHSTDFDEFWHRDKSNPGEARGLLFVAQINHEGGEFGAK